MTSEGDKQYYYDVLGRLTLVESGLNSNVKLAAYRYDALGRLAMQVTYDYTHDPNDPNDPNDDDLYAASNVTKCFYYDTPAGGEGASSPVLPQVVEITDGDGETTDQFVWGPAYVDELLLHERDTDDDGEVDQRLYAAHDTLYSVLELVDEDGNVIEQYSYSPYGADPTDPRKGAARITDGDENELTPDNSVAEYLYTGRQFDKTVGLNYHRARRLSHSLGRWTRRDPVDLAAPTMPVPTQGQKTPEASSGIDSSRTVSGALRCEDGTSEYLRSVSREKARWTPRTTNHTGQNMTRARAIAPHLVIRIGAVAVRVSRQEVLRTSSIASYLDGPSLYEYARSRALIGADPSGLFFGRIQACKDALSAVATDLVGNAVGREDRFPGKSDKYMHCFHSCTIAVGCGRLTSAFLGAMREALQQFGDREGSIDDMLANVDGINCAKCVRVKSFAEAYRKCQRCCENAEGLR